MLRADVRPMNQRPLLVVEDDRATLGFYEALLTLNGYAVTLAADGHTARARAADTLVAGIVLDNRLPDTSGVELCRELRTTLGPDIAILLVTADHDLTLESRGFAAGATSFVRKPFMADVLLTLLATYVPDMGRT